MASVTMFVTNAVRGDNRVLKEARALQEAGHEVLIVGRWFEGLTREEHVVDGVRVRLIDGDQRYRMQKAERYNQRRLQIADDYKKVYADLGKHIERLASQNRPRLLKMPFIAKRLAGKAYKMTATRAMGYSYRLQSRLSWKLEPLIFLRDWKEAVLEIGDLIRADVWHAHDLDALPAALECKKQFGGKVIYDAHEYWLDCNNDYSRFARQAWAVLERTLIGKADAVITVSPSIAKVLAKRYDVAEPAVVLNAPDFSQAVRSDYLRDTLKIPHDQFILIYVGLVTQERGYEILLRALASLQGVQLVCLGPGHAEYKTKLAEQARELGIGQRVHFLAPVPVGDIQKVTASADAGLVVVQRNALSYELCLPSKFFEYIFAGIPVAVSDLVELRPLVDKFGLGVCFDEQREPSIAKAIEELMQRRSEFVGPTWDEVRQRVAKAYAWNERKNDLLQVYDGLGVRAGAVPS